MLPSVARTPISGYYAANAKITRSIPRERGLLCRKQIRVATRRNQKNCWIDSATESASKTIRIAPRKTYVGWARRYILFHNKRHPQEMGHLEIDFDRHQITVRAGKGDKDRVTLLPESAGPELDAQLQVAKALHQRDLAQGEGRAPLPYALALKYPNADRNGVGSSSFPRQSSPKIRSSRIALSIASTCMKA